MISHNMNFNVQHFLLYFRRLDSEHAGQSLLLNAREESPNTIGQRAG